MVSQGPKLGLGALGTQQIHVIASSVIIPRMDLFPIVTLFLGYGASYATELLRDRRAIKREREAREAAHQTQVLERRVTFQVKTMLEMQEAATDLVQANTQFMIEWTKVAQARGDWLNARPRDAVFTRCLLAVARSEMIGARVDDPEVRKRIEIIIKHDQNLHGSKDQEAAEKELVYLFAHNTMLHKQIGEALHRLNAEEFKLINGKSIVPEEAAELKKPFITHELEDRSPEKS